MGKVDPYIHAVLVLHGLGKEITKENIVNVIKAAGGEVDEAKASVVAEAVKDVNIDEAIEKSAAVAVAPAPQQTQQEEKKEEKKEEKEEKKEEDAAAGLAALFG